MGLFKKLFGKKKKLSYQELTQIQTLLKQNTDCEKAICSTTTPSVFFSRLNMLLDNLIYLKQFENYDNIFTSMTPTRCYEIITSGLNTYVNEFLIRATTKKLEEVNKLKTEKAKLSNLKKFFDDMFDAFKKSNTFYSGRSDTKLYLGDLYTQENMKTLNSLYQKHYEKKIKDSCSKNVQLNTNTSVNKTKKESVIQKRQFPNSIEDLNKEDLILLKCMNYTEINQEENTPKLPDYLLHRYELDLSNAIKYLNFFLNCNLLEPVSLETTIKKHTIPQIKEVLQTKSITVKGKKSDLIQALYDNFTINELNAAFPPKYYVLSKVGKKLLDDRLNSDDCNYRYSNIDFDEVKKAIDALVESKAYENTLLYTNNPFKELPDYVSNNHEIFICTVINSKNSLETAKRILRRLFRIEDTLFYVERYNAVLRSEKELRESKETAKLLKNGYGEFYRICSMGDESVCDCCNAFNGKLLPVNKAVIGVNYPPFTNCSSEYCRCFVCFETAKKEK